MNSILRIQTARLIMKYIFIVNLFKDIIDIILYKFKKSWIVSNLKLHFHYYIYLFIDNSSFFYRDGPCKKPPLTSMESI